MSKRVARSARGDVVNFDVIAVKQQLATTPVPVSVNQRRQFIDEKDGIKPTKTVVDTTVVEDSPLALAQAAAAESAESAK